MIIIGYKNALKRNDQDDKTKGPNYINDWNFNPIGTLLTIRNSFEAHQAKIMDVVELRLPPALAKCSLDHSIKIWDMYSGKLLGVLNPPHESGVRSLDYTPFYSGYIVSVGYECYTKVWSPEVSIKQAYAGMLEGHNVAVVSAKFIQKSPVVITIDQNLSIRVWDIRTLACLQVISQDRKKFDCNGLTVLGMKKHFVIYGRRLIQYDTSMDTGTLKLKRVIDEIYPINAIFNKYYKTFMIVTK